MNISDLARKTLLTLKERHLKPTPENYSEVFEELANKAGVSSSAKVRLENYQNKLLPAYKREAESKNIKSLDEFISFLISTLNRQSGKNFTEFFELLNDILKILQISRDKKVRDIANLSFARLLKTLDRDAILMLNKKWKEFEQSYEDIELDKTLRPFGVSKFDDFELALKKLVAKLNERSPENFAKLLTTALKPSLTEDLKLNGFIAHINEDPSAVLEKNFSLELNEFVNRRFIVDDMFVQKNLNYLNENLAKIHTLFNSLNKTNDQNLDFIENMQPNSNGNISVNFENLRQRFELFKNKLELLNAQIMKAQNSQEMEEYSVAKELAILDDNFAKYKINYAVAIFSITNYRVIMQKYGLGSLNEIFAHFKKILKDSCLQAAELWMIDEKSYLIISPGKSMEQIQDLVNNNLSALKNLKFIYKQDVIVPKIKALCMDKSSKPNTNLLDEMLDILAKDESEDEI